MEILLIVLIVRTHHFGNQIISEIEFIQVQLSRISLIWYFIVPYVQVIII